MHVIGHPAIGVNARAIALDDLGADPLEQLPIGGCKEDVLAVITAKRYVIERARHVNAEPAGHPCPPLEDETRLAHAHRIDRTRNRSVHMNTLETRDPAPFHFGRGAFTFRG
jgi:hypothetical protein